MLAEGENAIYVFIICTHSLPYWYWKNCRNDFCSTIIPFYPHNLCKYSSQTQEHLNWLNIT